MWRLYNVCVVVIIVALAAQIGWAADEIVSSRLMYAPFQSPNAEAGAFRSKTILILDKDNKIKGTAKPLSDDDEFITEVPQQPSPLAVKKSDGKSEAQKANAEKSAAEKGPAKAKKDRLGAVIGHGRLERAAPPPPEVRHRNNRGRDAGLVRERGLRQGDNGGAVLIGAREQEQQVANSGYAKPRQARGDCGAHTAQRGYVLHQSPPGNMRMLRAARARACLRRAASGRG